MNSPAQEFSPNRENLASLLERIDGTRLRAVLTESWFNKLVSNASEMVDCGQGDVIHLEGDVAIHTGLVFDAVGQTAVRRLGRQADFIERFSAVLHDCRKPATRVDHGDGRVSFPGHEALAADEVPLIARRLQLSTEDAARLEFVVRHHGDAHSWPTPPDEIKVSLKASPFFQSLALLQEADALSCSLMPVYWDSMCSS